MEDTTQKIIERINEIKKYLGVIDSDHSEADQSFLHRLTTTLKPNRLLKGNVTEESYFDRLKRELQQRNFLGDDVAETVIDASIRALVENDETYQRLVNRPRISSIAAAVQEEIDKITRSERFNPVLWRREALKRYPELASIPHFAR